MFFEIYACIEGFSWADNSTPSDWGQWHGDRYGTLFIEDRNDGYVIRAEDWLHAAFTV